MNTSIDDIMGAADMRRWQRADEAMKTLSVSQPTLYRWARLGVIRKRKVEGAAYFDVGGFFRSLELDDLETGAKPGGKRA